VITLPLTAAAFKEGPYPNVTGGFGEPTCHLCHLDNPLNAAGGGVALDGIPARFTPGQRYPITVTISRAGSAAAAASRSARDSPAANRRGGRRDPGSCVMPARN